MNLTEVFIQRKIQDGDIREFEHLFAKYYEPLCHYADNILNDMDMAEDLVQDFFYHFWKNRKTIIIRFSLSAYFHRSIRNNALRYLEHLSVRRNYIEKMTDSSRDITLNHSINGIELKDLSILIDTTLQQMPERCSRIFRMNRFDGKKYHEIAELLSISVKTVEADMGKALQMFRKSLKEYTT